MRNKTLALGIGSNLANPIENLRQALFELKKSALFEVLEVSSIYESDALLPEGATPSWNKKFLNAVVTCRVSGDGTPQKILQEIKKIEIKLGRKPDERWAPRLIDIDILYWDQEIYTSTELQIPHKNLLDRPFALLPLLEIWSDISLNLPDWATGWVEEIPFNTRKSLKYFWPRMVGILNITKDSFSDGGHYLNTENLNSRVAQLIEQGADIIDIGAESTRPGAMGVSADEEFKNLDWALREIKSAVSISLDCRNAKVAARILEIHPIDFLNDVTGFSGAEMRDLLIASKLKAFVMHSLSIPPNGELILDEKINPCLQLTEWWLKQSRDLTETGVLADQLIFDPGIGFGKNKQQSFFILRHLEQLSTIKNPVMIGHSRKSFLSLISDRPAEARDLETALVTKDLNLAYVQYLRVHDVQSQLMALK